MPPSRFNTMWPSYVVLAASLAVTVLASVYVETSIRGDEAERFESSARLVDRTIDREMARYIDVLSAARAYFESAESVSRSDWSDFCNSVNLAKNYPGAQALGFAPLVTHNALAAHEAVVRAEGFPDYKVRPREYRDGYTPIEYIEPMNIRNRGTLGFDMSSEPTRHEAMNRAMQENVPVATDRTILMQENEAAPQAGFLIYLPVYRKNLPLDTPEQRSAALAGFVYSPYRVTVLLRSMLESREEMGLIDFQLFDGDPAAEGELLFDSRSQGAVSPSTKMPPAPLLGKHLESIQRLTVGTREWTLVMHPSARLTQGADHNLPWLVLLGGALISWLLFGVSWLQMRGRAQSDLAAARIAESELLLRESELRYRLKIEQSPLAVQTFSPDGAPVSVNHSWETLWELSFADLAGYNILNDPEFERNHLSDQIRSAFAGETVNIGPIFYDPRAMPSKKGRGRWVRSVLYPVTDLHGKINEVVLIHQDVTDRIQAEEELQRAKEAAEAANHAKDQFLAVLSHELRNPLSPVLSMVNLLQDPSLSAAESRDAVDTIRRNVELEARLIDDLLDITRISRGKMHLDVELVNAHTIIQHAMQICNDDMVARKLRLEVDLDAPRHILEADPARLQQVCWNLIKNAVKFTPEHGAITIRTRNIPAADESPMLEISVSDTGIGIAPDKLANIFDAFEQADRSITRRFGGLGLGLAITKALVEAHHGEIEATSEGLQRGATFTVRLPAAVEAEGKQQPSQSEQGSGAAPRAGPAREPRVGPLRILVVEDQADARRGLRVLLEHNGYQVKAAATAGEALEIAREWPYDLLISDIGLPDQSGFDLAPQLLALHTTPAIALTGFGMEQDVQRAREAGFDQHLTKPVHFDRLEQAIRSLTNA